MNTSIIVFYILNSFSLLISLIILCFIIINKIGEVFISELMTYILISEIIYSSSIYLSFSWNSCFNVPQPIPGKCFRYNMIGNIQMYFLIMCDFVTILSTLAIAIKIYDSFKANSHIFQKNSGKLLTRLSIFALALIYSISLGSIQLINYQDYNEHEDEKPSLEKGQCLVMNCLLASLLTTIQVSSILFIIIILFVINLINYCFLRQNKKIITLDNDEKDKSKALKNINIASWRIMILPLVSLLVFCFLYFDRMLKVFTSDDYFKTHVNSWFFRFSGYSFGITNGLRGLIFSAVIVYSSNNLQKAIMNYFKKNDDDISFDIDNELSLQNDFNQVN